MHHAVRADRARLQDPHHGERDGERAQRARPRCRPGGAPEPAHRRFHPQHPAARAASRSSPASRSTAPISTWTARRPMPTGAISTGRWRRHGAANLTSTRQRLRLPARLLLGRSGRGAAQRLQPRRGAALRHEAAAIQRPGDGQGARGHRLLPLQPLRRAERGRRRSRPASACRSRRSIRPTRSAPSSWPHAMLGTSTHDTKRGEDTRARLAVLSELPEEWARQVTAWSRTAARPPWRRRGHRAAGPQRRVPASTSCCSAAWPAELLAAAPTRRR